MYKTNFIILKYTLQRAWPVIANRRSTRSIDRGTVTVIPKIGNIWAPGAISRATENQANLKTLYSLRSAPD